MTKNEKFSDYYYSSMNIEWKKEYFDYNGIKKEILKGKNEIVSNLDKKKVIKFYGKNNVFTDFIDNIKEKIVEDMNSVRLFYILKEGELLRLVYRLLIEYRSLEFDNIPLVNKFFINFKNNLNFYKNLIDFINLNLLALVIILEKLDKEFNILDNKILNNFFQENLNNKNNNIIKTLLNHKGVIKSFFTMKKIFKETKIKFNTKTENTLNSEFDSMVIKRKITSKEKIESNLNLETDKDILLINDFIKKNIDNINTNLPTLNFNEDSIIRTKEESDIKNKELQINIKKSIYDNYNNIALNINSNIDNLENIKLKLEIKIGISKSDRFNKEDYDNEVNKLFLKKNVSEEDYTYLKNYDDKKNDVQEKECDNVVDLWLILIGTSIFIFNYYGWSVNAKGYLELLGLDKKYLGMISAITPFAAFLMVFILNYTTTFGFKISKYFCLVLLILGNFLYFFAFYLKSLYVLMIGKILVGLGGCRLLPRKYLAIMVRENFRSKYSAIFVGMTCIATGLGPGIVYYINLIGDKERSDGIYSVINDVNKFTIIITIIWIIYSIIFFLLFKDNKKQINKELLKSRYKELAITKVFTKIENKNNKDISIIKNYLQDNMHSNLNYFYNRTMNIKQNIQKNASLNISSIKKDHYNLKNCELNNKYLNNKNIYDNKEINEELKFNNQTTFQRYFPNSSTILISLLVLYTKFVQETIVNEISYSYKIIFKYKNKEISYFFTCLIFYSLFFSFLMIYLSKRIQDKKITIFGLCLTLIACFIKADILTILNIFDKTNLWYFNISSALVYIGTLVLEGSAISLLSKVISPSYQLGYWNSGLITGAFDTLGKALGNSFISVFQIIVPLFLAEETNEIRKYVTSLCYLYLYYSLIGFIFFIFCIFLYPKFTKYSEIRLIVKDIEKNFEKNI